MEQIFQVWKECLFLLVLCTTLRSALIAAQNSTGLSSPVMRQRVQRILSHCFELDLSELTVCGFTTADHNSVDMVLDIKKEKRE